MRDPIPYELASESTKRWWRWPRFVYFLGAGEGPKAIKVGMGARVNDQPLRKAVAHRLAAIQSCNHERIELLGLTVFETGQSPTRDAEQFERRFQTQFENLYRFKLGSRGAEWFNVSPDLLREIGKVAEKPCMYGLPPYAGQLPEKECSTS